MKQLKLFFTLCIFAFVAIACSDNQATPEATTKEFVKLFYEGKGNTNELMDIIYLPQSKEISSNEKEMLMGKLSMLQLAAQDEIASRGGIKEFTIDNVSYNDEKTAAEVTLTFIYQNKDVNSANQRLSLTKEDKKWKVNF